MRTAIVLLSALSLPLWSTAAAQNEVPTKAESPVILVEKNAFPYVHLNLYFRVGPSYDPPGLEGLTTLTNRALIRGSRLRGRAAFEEAVEALGTELNTSTQGHAVSLGGAVLSRNLPAFMALLTELLDQPRLAPEEIEKVKREMLAELESSADDDGVLARRWFRKLVFEGQRFEHGASGTPESLAKITPADVRAHFERFYTADNALLAVSGDVSQADITPLKDALWAVLPTGPAVDWVFEDQKSTLTGRRVALIDKADRTQVQIMIGHPSLDAADPDYHAIHLATTALGGTFTARLMQEVRVKRGWSYGAYARLASERVGGYWLMTAAPETGDAVATTALMIAEYEKFVAEGLTDDEVEFARNYLINAFAFGNETVAMRAAQRARAELLGRGADFVSTYVDTLKRLSPTAVREAVRRRLDPANLQIVVVCTAPDLRDDFAALPGVSEVTVRPASD